VIVTGVSVRVAMGMSGTVAVLVRLGMLWDTGNYGAMGFASHRAIVRKERGAAQLSLAQFATLVLWHYCFANSLTVMVVTANME